MYYWNIYLMWTLLTLNMQYIHTQSRALRLDCSVSKKKYNVTVIIISENEDCVPPGSISCKVKASPQLTSLLLRETKSPYSTVAIFPVDTWKERELELIFDNSEVTIVPNTSEYHYLLPRGFETVSGRGFVDVECGTYITPMRTTSPMDTNTETVPGSLSSLHVALTTMAILVFLALVIVLVIFLIRRYRLRDHKNSPKAGRGKNKRFALAKSNSATENEYRSRGELGAAVYVDPAAPSDYDNKDQGIENMEKPTSEEYSYPYMDISSAAKNHGNGGKPPEINRHNSEIPYEDVEGQSYSYAYSAASRTSGKNI